MTGPFGTRLPLVAAPMAGGASSLALIRAASAAGAYAFLPGGYKSAETLAAEVRELKAQGVDFGVNLFASGAPGDVAQPYVIEATDYARYAAELTEEAAPYGIDLAEIPLRDDDDAWTAKLAVLLADPVSWVSTTFGAPSAEEVAALHAVGTRVAVTVTKALEARWIDSRLDVDLLIVQGPHAGGHSGAFIPGGLPPGVEDQRTSELIPYVAHAARRTPLIAGGGVDGPAGVREILDAGAGAVVVGTLLLRSDESGAPQTHKEALADPRFTATVRTHAFTGRPARGLLNGFIERHEATAPVGYPALHHLTAPLRRAAAAEGDPERLHLWAGTGYRAARQAPVGEILAELAG